MFKPETTPSQKTGNGIDRRKFLGQVGAAAAVAAGALASPTATLAGSGNALDFPSAPDSDTTGNARVLEAFETRVAAAIRQASIPVPPHTTNGDEARYPDKSGTYSKALLQDTYAVVNPAAFQSFKTALTTGNPSDFEKIIMGGTRTLNGPQGAFAFGLMGTDGIQFGNAPSHANQEHVVLVPPPPAVASAAYGTELVELYWDALLRDVAFTDYATNPLAELAAQELSSLPSYVGPRDKHGNVTPHLLFRGGFPGETIGPYMSQLFITPTFFGQQPISQQMVTYQPAWTI